MVDAGNGKINATILANPQRLNLYSYGSNNPYLYVDLDGEFVFAAVPLFAAGAWALDAMMPKSTDVSDSMGALDYMDKATVVAPVGAGIKITQMAFKLSSTAKSAKGVTGLLRNNKYNFRIDTNKVASGEGGFHIHLYRGKTEVAKLSRRGAYARAHNNRTLLKPSHLPKDVRQDLRKLVNHTRKKIKKSD